MSQGEINGKEVIPMLFREREVRAIQQERARRLHESARRQSARPERPAPRRRRRPEVRRAIGRSMVRLGTRLAADPGPHTDRTT
ncbi:hypothetical protein BH20CHL6_BH20CHL6_08070 [soil metagenome]